MQADQLKWISLRIRRRYFDLIIKDKKPVEYRKFTPFWRHRLLGSSSELVLSKLPELTCIQDNDSVSAKFLPYTPMAAVFICGKDLHRCPITAIEVLITPKTFSLQGQKDVDTPICFGIHLEKRPDGARQYALCSGPFCNKEYHWVYPVDRSSLIEQKLEFWCEGCIDEARLRAQDADYIPDEEDEV